FFQAEDGIRDFHVTGVQTCALPILIHIDRAFLRAAQEVQAGTYRPHVESETVKSGVIECVLNPRLAELVGEQMAAKCRTVVEERSEERRVGKEWRAGRRRERRDE